MVKTKRTVTVPFHAYMKQAYAFAIFYVYESNKIEMNWAFDIFRISVIPENKRWKALIIH